MIALGIAIIVAGIALAILASDAGQSRTERIRYDAANERAGRDRRVGRQIGGWR